MPGQVSDRYHMVVRALICLVARRVPEKYQKKRRRKITRETNKNQEKDWWPLITSPKLVRRVIESNRWKLTARFKWGLSFVRKLRTTNSEWAALGDRF